MYTLQSLAFSCLDTADNFYSNFTTSSVKSSISMSTLCCPELMEMGITPPPLLGGILGGYHCEKTTPSISINQGEKKEDKKNKIIVQTTHVTTDNHPY